MGDGRTGFVVPELDDTDVASLATIQAMRDMGNTLNRVADALRVVMEKVSSMHTDIEIMKVKDARTTELAIKVADMEKAINELRMRDAQQDGAAKLLQWMKEFGPWLIAILAFAWGLFSRKP